jgi:hypothetical protein
MNLKMRMLFFNLQKLIKRILILFWKSQPLQREDGNPHCHLLKPKAAARTAGCIRTATNPVPLPSPMAASPATVSAPSGCLSGANPRSPAQRSPSSLAFSAPAVGLRRSWDRGLGVRAKVSVRRDYLYCSLTPLLVMYRRVPLNCLLLPVKSCSYPMLIPLNSLCIVLLMVILSPLNRVI